MSTVASQIANVSFVQTQIKENIKAPRHWSLWGVLNRGRWIPRTKDQ